MCFNYFFMEIIMRTTSPRRNVQVSTGLHPVVYAALAACTLWIVAAIWAFFARDLYSAVQLGVATVFAAMFLATPLVLSRLSGRRNGPTARFREWADGEMEIIDGTVEAKHAFAMVLTAPIACAVGITAIGLVAWLTAIGIM
jgi:hypothetical protein